MEIGRIDRIFDGQKQRSNSPQKLDYESRIASLLKLKECIEQNLGPIHQSLASDLGKSDIESFSSETSFVLKEIKDAIKSLKKWMRPKRVAGGALLFPSRSYIMYEPLGVCLIIGPWNYPFQLLFSPLVGALAAGNSVILKPSEMAPATSSIINKIVSENFRPEILAVVEGAVEETTYLLEKAFDKIFYTGSTRVGRIIMEKAAKHLTPVTLELGGKSPCLVWDCKNIEMAARRIVWGKFYNTGQTCVAPDYVLIHEDQKEIFVDKLKKYIDLHFGGDPKKSQDYGRIINESHFDRLVSLVDSNKILCGGEFDKSNKYISPTLVSASAEDKVMEDEIFGPILPILTFKNIGNAISFIKNRPKPLAFYAFSTSDEVEENVLNSISSGGICLNDTIMHLTNSNLPFGGVGESGMGHYHGYYSFEVFSHKKAVMKRYFFWDLELRYPPFSEKKSRWLKRLLNIFS